MGSPPQHADLGMLWGPDNAKWSETRARARSRSTVHYLKDDPLSHCLGWLIKVRGSTIWVNFSIRLSIQVVHHLGEPINIYQIVTDASKVVSGIQRNSAQSAHAPFQPRAPPTGMLWRLTNLIHITVDDAEDNYPREAKAGGLRLYERSNGYCGTFYIHAIHTLQSIGAQSTPPPPHPAL
jgi:hypothetical protein